MKRLRAPRLIAVGDIHGHVAALRSLLRTIEPQVSDIIVTLGDYVNRGPESAEVLEHLIELGSRCQLVPILGNHDEMMLDARRDPYAKERWLESGGREILASYGPGASLADIPETHWKFLHACLPHHETSAFFFIHANYDPWLPLDRQPYDKLRWISVEEDPPRPHYSGKTAIVGHTAQKSGTVLDLGFLKCLDTGCGFGGLLTAMDLQTAQQWQVSECGRAIQSG